ncbi:MAG: PASTA domain-containing protein [Chlorobia bacterium]|nr:PASTA domain-containing protein [Fimbriimonadaceae bacterium]
MSDGPIFTLFRAKDRVQGKEVSVRLFKPPFDGEAEFVDAVRNVVSQYSKAGGAGIESLYEIDDHDGQHFVVGEPISGHPLQERIDKLAPFSVSVAVSTAISICEALGSLHQSGIAHGDLSAKNILAQADGQCRLQLAGIWEALSASQTAGMIALPGMSPYLAPEVSAGSMPSPSSDVYSVGVLLYQLLSGRFPFSADSPVAMALKHATAAVPSVKIFNSAVPIALDEIVKRAMAKDPAVRYSTASELLSDLRILQDGLRFGKPLTSPIKQPVPTTEKQPVAPKMSAIREPEKNDKQKKDKAPRDVPVWLLIVFGFFAVVFLSLIGMWVVFNVSQPKLVVVPNIKGSKMSEAGKTLEGLKLKLRVFGRETNEMQPPDTILSMSPPAGRKLHEGSTVNVKISTGSRLVTVPDLTGSTVDKARAMLEALNLSLTESYTSQPDSKLDAGMIISQSPTAKAKVDRFGRVSIVVSSGKTGGPPINAEQDKQYLYNLKIKLSGLTESVVLRVEIVDARGERTIYESPHEPEDNVEIPAQGYGKVATFKIYYDNQLVTTKEKKAEDEAPQPN